MPSVRDSKVNSKKSSKKEKEKAPKRGGPKDKDNMDDFIDDNEYTSDEYSDSDISMTSSEKRALKKKGRLPKSIKESLSRRPARKAAVKAREEIKKKLSKKESSSESSDSTWKPKNKSRRRQEEEEEEDEEDSETLGSEDTDEEEEEMCEECEEEECECEGDEEDEEDEEEEEEEEEDEEEEDDDKKSPFKGISLFFDSGEMDHMIPRRHNMKKEPEHVKKFVKLLTKPVSQNTIDDQIDQFKTLGSEKQKAMLEALERRSDYAKNEQPLMFRLLQMKLNPEMMSLVMSRYNSLNTMDPASGEYYKLRTWMEKLVSIPLGIYKDMPVRLEDNQANPNACMMFMEKAKKCLDDAIYGQEDAKLQIMQFIASKISNPTANGLSLLLAGPPGIGKTSLIKGGIAKALEWPFQFVSLGGDSDATTYTGHQFVYEGSHTGKIANCLAAAKSMSLVLMFDELDKVSETPKGAEIQNLLVHLTDSVQNMEFEDKYLSGIPLDMSRAMFVFSGNDINKIDKILMDRMVVVHLNGYEPKDKIAIAEKFLIPGALREVNLSEKVSFTREVIQYILETYAKEEPGVRELKRCMEQIAQRINVLRMFNVKELPFHIPGFNLPFMLKKEHVDLFLKKKDVKEKVPYGMYC